MFRGTFQSWLIERARRSFSNCLLLSYICIAMASPQLTRIQAPYLWAFSTWLEMPIFFMFRDSVQKSVKILFLRQIYLQQIMFSTLDSQINRLVTILILVEVTLLHNLVKERRVRKMSQLWKVPLNKYILQSKCRINIFYSLKKDLEEVLKALFDQTTLNTRKIENPVWRG